MCGIAGFAGLGDQADLRSMTRALSHRGPDAESLYSDPCEPVHLGHRRLAVVDLDGGSQPMWTTDSSIGVVFNGEIYNHAELRETLETRGHVFVSDHSDTEVLLHGYRQWGNDLVHHLNGMWAFALYDRAERRMLLSRDRFGQKPLYWWRERGVFAFASELTAIARHHRFEATIDPVAVRKYFGYGFIPAPRSIYRGVHKLPAGCNLTIELPNGKPAIRHWWRFCVEPDAALGHRGQAHLAEQLRERLESAVARRMVADVPVGVLLSGGIDSSSIAAIAARHRKPGELRTFSIGFDQTSFDESRYALSMARYIGSEHRSVRFTASHASGAWSEVASHLDEPMADVSLLPTQLLCGIARRDVTVALSGDGADELFAGYAPFRALRRAQWYQRLVPQPVHRAVMMMIGRLPTSHDYLSWDFKLKRTLGGLSHPPRMWNAAWMAPLAPGEIAELIAEPIDPEELFEEAIDAWDESRRLTLVDRSLQFFTRLYLSDDILTKVDRASMAHGLEVRSPFLDIDLVDLARRIPSAWKLRHGQPKWILRKAVEPWLPAEIAQRTKQGFGIPISSWIAKSTPPFDKQPRSAFARKRLEAHKSRRGDHRLYLYAQWLLDGFQDRHPNENTPA